MKQLTCEMCGSTDLMKQDGVFACQTCGTKYSVEEAKRMMVEGTVDVQGTVKVDNTAFVQKYLANAQRARQKEDWSETEKYYNMVEQNDPTNIEAIFYSTFARVKSALLEAETKDKRQGVFNVLVKSVSIIDDNYDNTNEEHQKLLFEIMDDINGLKKDKIVPTTHLQEYVTKNGYGNIVDRNQVVENDSLSVTYAMIDEVLFAYMDSLANIIIAHSQETVKKLFVENIKSIPMTSEVHEKAKAFLPGYRTPRDISIEISNRVIMDNQTSKSEIDRQIIALAGEICPSYLSGVTLNIGLHGMVLEELRSRYPNSKLNPVSGCGAIIAVFAIIALIIIIAYANA